MADKGPDTPTFDLEGLDLEDKTTLGFGGKDIPRRLHRGDTLYLLMRCDVTSETEKETDNGVKFSSGCRTVILAELDARQAAEVAAG